ncbi:MAG: triose-phosphate isomerase [Pseudomonadota bacterium]|nr:triose-phosphate isomerase [Pseudomonadota bacterium]
MSKREVICAGNWKLHKSPRETREYMQEFLPQLKLIKCEVVIFPQALSCEALALVTKDSSLKWGGQNCYFENLGAFTGENSASALSEMGARYVLVGHSERRKIFGEGDELLAKKVMCAQKAQLIPMLCLGEDLSERESAKTNQIIAEQLKKGLAKVDFTKTFTIAYEPVWAIGTGKVATPEQAEDAHKYLREVLKSIAGGPVAEKTSILYGGSVKSDNAKSLIEKENIDGFLVGGASLEVKSFLAIASSC